MKNIIKVWFILIILFSCEHANQVEMGGATAGVGTTFYRYTDDDWVPIAEVRAIVGPSMSKDTINVTSLDTLDGYAEFSSGFMNGGVISLAMSFTRENYELFKQDFESQDSVYYGIMLPDEEDTFIDFIGLVTELPLGVAADDKIDVNVKIQVSGVLEVESSSGVEPSSEDSTTYIPAAPTALALEQIQDYVQVDFTDNTGGTAQHEIWSRRTYWLETEDWQLVTTLDAGTTTYNDRTWQNSTMEYQVRAKDGSTYSDYCSVESILTNWTFKVTVTSSDLTVNIYDIHLYAYDKLVVLHWGDGETTDATDVHTHAYEHTYDEEGVYWFYMTGDVDWINFFQWFSEEDHLEGTYIDKWTLPDRLQFGHLYENGFLGDITNLKYPPMCLGCHFGGNHHSWDITNLHDDFPEDYWDLHIHSRLEGGITGDVSDWPTHPNFAHFFLYGDISGDLTGYFATWTPNYGGVIVRMLTINSEGLYGDLSTWNMPTKPWDLIVSLGGCHFTGMPRGEYAGCYGFDFGNNNCSSEEIDDFLEYLADYFTGESSEASSAGSVVPQYDCDYTLTGANMGTPSSAALVHIDTIIAAYAAAGFTCNIYVNS